MSDVPNPDGKTGRRAVNHVSPNHTRIIYENRVLNVYTDSDDEQAFREKVWKGQRDPEVKELNKSKYVRVRFGHKIVYMTPAEYEVYKDKEEARKRRAAQEKAEKAKAREKARAEKAKALEKERADKAKARAKAKAEREKAREKERAAKAKAKAKAKGTGTRKPRAKKSESATKP